MVIGILAAITIVAFNGVQNKAKVASLQVELTGAAKKLELYKYTPGNSEQYPGTLAAAELATTSSNILLYYPNGSTYCLIGVMGNLSYYVSNAYSSPQQGACIISTGLAGWWTMDGNASDSSGNGMTGAVSGATLVTGQNGQASSAYGFDGIGNYISLTSSTPLNLNVFSVSAWVKMDANIGASTWNDIVMGTSTNDWGVGVNANASGSGFSRVTKVSILDATASSNEVTRQVWKHIVMTYSGSQVLYYIDGQLDYTTNFSQTFISSTKRIGSRNGSGYFHGAIDDLRAYNRVLTAPEVVATYNAGAQ